MSFKRLATLTGIPSTTLHRKLSRNGAPNMETLAAIFGAFGNRLNVRLNVHSK